MLSTNQKSYPFSRHAHRNAIRLFETWELEDIPIALELFLRNYCILDMARVAFRVEK